ncbi:MAG TPA: hypothetical protein VNO31_48095 [Umezawaea sp.]|nr:hypothetical protein [Umezawaea sp.]
MIEFGRGRILQVTVAGVPAFWTNPSAADWNIGGDRLWLGPERDWFYSSGGLADHVVPASIDPGPWSDGPPWSADVVLVRRRTGLETHVGITREVTVLGAGVYETRTTVNVHSGLPVSAWSIVSVPLGGVLELPLADALTYHDYLDPIDPARLEVADGRLSLRLTGDTMTKIGLPPSVVGGPLTYTVGGLRVERAVTVHPDRTYCDLPIGATGQGDAVQVFEDDGHYGGYAELEHHSPAATVEYPVIDVCRTTVSVDTSY